MHQPTWLKDAVFYQVYPQSFCDSNGDGIGDLNGLSSRLDYIKGLGVTALWLNPIFESPFGDAGYDVSDFRKVAPRYGTNADAVRLFREAHKRGLKVVLDLVAGHTSDRHPWFRQACRGADNPLSNRYIFTGDEPYLPPFGGKAPKVPGRRGGHYIANFLPFQPALNYGHAEPDPARPWQLPAEHPDCLTTRAELRDIMAFWLGLGCDGFRVDMASSLVKGENNAAALGRLWQGFRGWFDREHPEAVLVSEWSSPIEAIDAGFHIDFLIHFGETAYMPLIGPGNRLCGKSRRPHVFFERAGEGDITLFLHNYLRLHNATKGRGYISLPTGNHDFARPRRGRDPDELRVLYTMLFTMPGVPFLYYGDEIGMRNLDGIAQKEGSMWRAGNRTPMQWAGGAPNLGFSTAPKKKLYLPLDPAPDAPTVSAQEADPDSLLHFTRGLIALRQAHPALGNDGGFRPLYASRISYPFIYERSSGTTRFAVVINPGEADVAIELAGLERARTIFGDGVKIRGKSVSVRGVSAAVLKLPATRSGRSAFPK